MKLQAHTAATILSDTYHACSDSTSWLRSLPPGTTASEAWLQCQRGDWMLWILGRLSGPPESDGRKRVVLCACECARLALVHVPDGEDRPRIAIETAEAWARGEATIEHVRTASSAAALAASSANAASSADAAYSPDAAYAAYAVAYAAYAAYADAASYAALAASSADAAAAYADAYAADATAAALARPGTLAQCADIVRKHYPTPPRLRA